jgi:hypothetical protein
MIMPIYLISTDENICVEMMVVFSLVWLENENFTMRQVAVKVVYDKMVKYD